MPTISFSGIASGIDGDAVIKALLDSRRLAEQPLKTRLTQLDDEDKALNEFKTKVLTLNDRIKTLLTSSGSAITRTVKSGDNDSVSAVAGSNAVISDTAVTVNRLASAATASFSNSFSAASDLIAPGISGTEQLTIKIGSGSKQQIKTFDITSTTKLSELVDSINANGDGLFRASVVNLNGGDPADYRLTISGVATGEQDGALSIEQTPGLASSGGLNVGSTRDAVDAEVLVQGLGIVHRSSNQISDLIPGVTLSLKKVTVGAVSLSVSNDTSKTAEMVNDLISSINDIVSFSRANSKIERVEGKDGANNIYGSLARESSDEALVSQLKGAMSGSSSGISGGAVNILADLGITTERDGTFKFKPEEFTKAMASNAPAVENLLHSFADQLGSTDGVIYNYTKFQGSFDSVIQANNEEREQINARIQRTEDSLDKQQEALKRQFAALESTISRLNSQGSAIASLFARQS